MARNGSGVYSLPAGSTVANGDTSDASDINTPLQDLEADMNVARPVVAGGTGATSASAARTNLGLIINTDVQAYDADLAAIAGLTSAADRLPYFTGAGTAALATFTAAGRALVDDADAAAQRTTLGLGTAAVENTVPLSKGGTGASLTDPNADRILFWDDSAGAVAFLTPGNGLAISGTSISDSDIFFRLDSAHAGANSTSVQNVFPQSVTLDASTVYQYEFWLSMGKTAGTTSHGLSVGFGGTHTLNNVLRHYTTTAFNSALTETNSLTAVGYLTSSALRDMTGASAFTNATANFYIREAGTFSVNGSGTWFPSYQLSSAPGGAWSTVAGSFVRLRRLGASGSNSSQGTWA